MADLLTALRLLLAGPTAVSFARPDSVPDGVLALFVAVAIATDYFDGVVARRAGTASARGQLFDHTTDFLFVTSGLAGCALAGRITWVLPPLIVVAFSQYVLDSYYLHRQKQLRMSTLGRWNGLLYFVPLVVVALSRLELFGAASGALQALAMLIGYVLAVSTVVSMADRALAPRAPGGSVG